MKQLQRLGWEWRQNGAIVSVRIDGQDMQVFVPLARIFLHFDQELASVGCPFSGVGEPMSVGGFFSWVKKAASSTVNKFVPNAVKRAASAVVSTAKRYGAHALSAVRKVPVLGAVAGATAALALLPVHAATQLVQGKRIDKIALGQFKTALGSVKTLAPYVQTVISFVPGVGQGISAGLGASLALAQGQSISDAVLAAARSAIPGGPLAAAAFDVATSVAQGKPLDQVALNALPISPAAKAALSQGLHAAKALATGQNVAQVALDAALHQLPPAAQKAVQIGVALGHAKSLQEVALGAARAKIDFGAGVAAAKRIQAGARTAQNAALVARGLESRNAVSQIIAASHRGDPRAKQLVGMLQGWR